MNTTPVMRRSPSTHRSEEEEIEWEEESWAVEDWAMEEEEDEEETRHPRVVWEEEEIIVVMEWTVVLSEEKRW